MILKYRFTKLLPAGIWFIIPTLVLWLIWECWPLLYTIYLSLTDWNLLGVRKFIGLHNYISLFHDPLFLNALKITIMWILFIVPAGVVIPFILAVLINSTERLKEFFRLTYFLPVITPIIATSLVWKYLYEPRYGLINFILSLVGIGGSEWLLDTRRALQALAIMHIWRIVGFNMVIFLAALQNIPENYYEAASIEGANFWRKTRCITLPLLKPVTMFVVFTTLIMGIGAFSEIYIMTEGGPMHSTTLLSYYLYEKGFKFLSMGYASAVAVASLIFTLILTAVLFIIMSDRQNTTLEGLKTKMKFNKLKELKINDEKQF